jgi:long-subunit fatty acid transport protein
MQRFQRSIFGGLVLGACIGAPALAQAAHAAVQQIYCNSASNLNRVALGDAAMRFDCPRIATEPLSVAALGRLGWRVQAAIAFGDETTNPRAGVFLLKGPKP